jgi:hypothetical protein
VSKETSHRNDDENDAYLFDELQEYVLEHYPNPQRVGCLDRETLSVFVEAPGKLDLADPKYLHIFHCAECTRDLMCLRRIREDGQSRSAPKTQDARARSWRFLGRLRDLFRRP